MSIMKRIILFGIILSAFGFVKAQSCEARSISILGQSLSETSGLLYLNGEFITFNDSGGEAELYEIDTADGGVQRTVVVQNATNVDWEAITADDDYIYIGDIGNNNGTRTNLKIYKISITDFENSNTVTAEVISFAYTNQTTFVSEPNATRFDSEAMAVVNSDLILFSKNWKENVCRYYSIPTTAGSYSVSPIDSIQTIGKVTGAVYLPSKTQLFLVGYAIEPFVHTLKNIVGTDLVNATQHSCVLDVANSIQVEGVCATNDRVFYSSEYFSFSTIELEGDFGEITYAFSLGVVENPSVQIKVRNSETDFYFETDKFKIKHVDVFDTLGKVQFSSKSNTKSLVLSKNQFKKGCYIIQLSLSDNKVERIKVIIE